MIKVKKSLALLITIFLIFSNAAFAQYSDPSFYEGKPIDESREGKDYYREGQVIVYSSKMGSEEERMMQRFMKGDISEEEIRRMAKLKLGKDFDEIKFQKGVMEFKERMTRKEAFSYEHEGYGQKYYIGPSYDGYSKEHMIFGMVFQHIGDEIDPREIKQHCNEPEKIADITIQKLKEKVGDLQNICSKAEDEESKCQEHAKKGCSQIGTPYAREDATELEKIQSVAFSCPVNKDAIIKACVLRSKSNIEQNVKYSAESCEKMFEYGGEKLLRECERFKENQICDKGKYIERCMGGIKKEDFEKPYISCPIVECKEGHVSVKDPSTGCPKCQLPNAAPRTTCKETDNGYDIHVKGTTYPEGLEHGKSDLCIDGKTLAEYGCNADGSYGGDKQHKCEFGCKEGACLRSVQTTACPEPITPTCSAGQALQKKTDDKGCVYYYCATAPCQEVSKPACVADEHLQAYYGNTGCITSYQCIKYQTACPEVQKPSCAEGQSLTTKYDDKNCIVGYECISITTAESAAKITGNVVASAYDDSLRHCQNSWEQQEGACASTLKSCDKDAMIEGCKQQSRKNYEDRLSNTEQNCDAYSHAEIRAAEDRCLRMDKERERCFEESTKRCEHMKGVAQKCRETLTEENLRKFIVEEARKRCKFTDIVADEDDVRKSDKVEIVLAVLNTATEKDIEKLELFIDGLKEDLKLQDTNVYKGMINPNNFGDIKLLPFVVNAKISAVPSAERAKESKAKIVARQKVEEAAGKLASLRDSDVPDEYLYIIEDKASDVLDVSDELEEIEKKEGQKGVGYKIRLFLGLARSAEQEEIKQLESSKAKLSNSIDALTKLIDEVPSDVAKAILKEQVENLKKQHADIEVLIETKAKKAKGLFGVFG